MANSDKNIIITPAIGSTTADPQIVFSGASSTLGPQNITLKAYPTLNGTLSFDGSAGQLFSITNSLTGSIFSVNDVSGIPSIEVLETGLVKIAQYSGNVTLGSSTATSSIDIANGATVSGATKTVNIGAGGLTGATTSINIGSSTGTSTTTLLGQVNLPRSSFQPTNISIGTNDGVNVNTVYLGSANSSSYSNIVIGATGSDGDYSTNTYMYGNVVFDPFVNLSFGGATFQNQLTANGILTLNGDANQNQTFASNQTQGGLQIGGTAQTTGTITIGGSGASSTGTITLGLSPAAQTVNIATGVNTSATKTINIGTGGSSNSVVNLSTAGAVVNYRGSGNFIGTFSIDNVTLNTSIMPTQGTGLITIGGTSSATGTITLGQSTVGQTTNIQAGATASGSTKILNIGTGGLSGSTTTIAIGSSTGTTTTTINGPLTVTATADSVISGVKVGRGGNAVSTNVVVGSFGLSSNTLGADNTAIGYGALNANTTGGSKVAVGNLAGYFNNGNRGVFIGNEAGRYTYNSSDQIAIGQSALQFSSAGSGQIGIGYASLSATTNGVNIFNITAVGSGYATSSAFNDIQLGFLTGSTSTPVGAGGTYPTVNITTNSSGQIATCVVSTTLPAYKGTRFTYSSTPTEMTFTGTLPPGLASGSGFKVTPQSFANNGLTGSFGNVGLGYGSLRLNTYGDQNTAIGWGTLENNTIGNTNCALGTQSMFNNTTGSDNMSFGRFAMGALTTGNNNMAAGTSALRYVTTSSRTVGIGGSAGALTGGGANVTFSENSTYIGSGTRALTAAADNNCIVIGADAISLGANTTVIGNSSTTQAKIFGQVAVGGSTPSGPTATGVAGTITWDAGYIYVCTATNTWKRVAISSTGW
jgi:hypothetical protein